MRRGAFQHARPGAGCVGWVRSGCWGMPQAVVPLVSLDAPENYTDAERNAGFIATNTAAPRPRSLPASADFSRSGTGGDAAFWLFGGDLYHGNALQVLRDVRQEMGAGDGPEAWTVGVLDRLRTKVEQINATLGPAEQAEIPATPSTGDELGREWLALALWATYGPSSAGGVRTITDLQLPRAVRWPLLGEASWPAAVGQIAVSVRFNPNDLARNPFVATGGVIDVGGTRPRNKSGWVWLVGLVGLAAVMED